MLKPLIVLAFALLLPVAFAQTPTVSDEVIQQLLEPLKTGMETQNIQLVLSVFDEKEVSGYPDLAGQLRAFFQEFDEVNFRYQLLQVAADKDRASATADVQMDALPYQDTHIPVRRSVQMRLQLKHDEKAWKITAFTPSDFFTINYTPH